MALKTENTDASRSADADAIAQATGENLRSMPSPIKVTSDAYLQMVERCQTEGVFLLSGSNPHRWIFPTGYTFDGTKTIDGTYGEQITGVGKSLVARLNPMTKITVVRRISGYVSSPAKLSLTNTYIRTNPKEFFVNGGFEVTDPWITLPKENLELKIDGLLYANAINNRVLTFGTLEAYRISADINFAAKNKVLLLGDSNMEASSITVGVPGTTITMEDVWTYRLKKWMNQNGADIRFQDLSTSGQTSAFFDELRSGNKIQTIGDPDQIWYNLGTNDGSAATVATNTDNFLKWALGRWKNVKIIVVAPVNAEASARQTLNQQIATAQQTVINNINSSRVMFINPLTAYTATDNSNYSGTESVGSGIHISVLGSQRLADFLIQQIQAHDAMSSVKFGVW